MSHITTLQPNLSIESTLNPRVGETSKTSFPSRRFTIVVFPALSKPLSHQPPTSLQQQQSHLLLISLRLPKNLVEPAPLVSPSKNSYMEVPTPLFYLLVLLVVHTLLCVVIVTFVQFHRWRTCSSLPTKYRHLPRRTKLANFGGRQTRRVAYYLWHWWVERVTPSLSNHLSMSGEDDFSEKTPHANPPVTPALLPESEPKRFPVALTAWAYVPVPFASRVVPIYEVTCKKEMEEAFRHLSLHFAIGVDVEHHQDRSYQGQTCLVQLGTRDCCFLLDPLVLPRGPLGRGLRALFAEPARVLIFHSPYLDLKWLHRDFGLNSVACTVLDTQKLPAALGLERVGICGW